jgi:uncharacterized RDD family membrane protein YckC
VSRDEYEDERDDLDISRPSERVESAGFFLRLIAYIIDSVILCCIGTPIGAVINLAFGAPAFVDFQKLGQPVDLNQQAANWVGNIVGIVIGWLYFALQESSGAQATLGKRVLGIIVTDMDGRRIGFGQATGRYFGKILSGLICCVGYFMVAFTEKSQGLHDILASTLVVRGTPKGD